MAYYSLGVGLRSSVLQGKAVLRAMSSSPQLYHKDKGPPTPNSRSEGVKHSFQLLALTPDECSVEDVRKAYIYLAKKCHPDANPSEEATEQFIRVREAYKQCTSYVKNIALTRAIYEALDKDLQEMDQLLGKKKHKNMTSRHFLTYDGVGPGTISERQKAFTQLRLDQAREGVFEKKFHDALIDNDSKALRPHTGDPWPKSTRVTNSLERIANEAIRDSIRSGEFANLSGKGQPMKMTWENPVLDNMEQKINVMLGNAGFTPDWISLDKDIKVGISDLKDSILAAWNRCGPRPMSRSKHLEWEQKMDKLDDKVKAVNRKIRDRNLKGPLTGQKVGISLDRLVVQVTGGVTPNQVVEPEVSQEEVATHKNTEGSSFIQTAGIVLLVVVIFRIFR